MLKLKITIGGQTFDFEGEAPFADVFKLAGDFIHAVLNTDQQAINDLTARLKKNQDTLSTAVDAASPSTVS